MKKAFLNKVISAFIAASTIGALVPLGVSAQVKDSLSNQNGQWYYSTNSTTQKGLVTINGTKYYINKSGIKQTGWIKDNGRFYYADNTGVIQTGIVKINGSIYYFNTNGVMQTGIVRIGNVTYTFSSNGQAIGNRIPTCNKEFDSNNSLVKPNQGNSNGTSTDNSVNNNNQNSSGNVTTPGNSGNSTGSNNNSSTGSTGTGNTTGSGVNVSGLPTVTQKYSTTIQSSAETKILELMNEKRKAAGLQPLTMDNTLLEVARYKSNHMIQNNYFSHTNPDGTNWTSWLKTLGYKYNATAENIAYNTSDPVELFNQWWNSAGHRENMMNASYTKVGIGVVYGNGKYMGTQTFSN